MHQEHEEAMRADFTEYVELNRQAYRPSVSEIEIEQLFDQRSVLADQWEAGPHAEHWDYLKDAHEDWRQAPDTMRRFMDNVEFNRDRSTGLASLSEVQQRSQEQARTLTDQHRTRPGIERGR